MHGLLFCFQYVPQGHCDFTAHSYSLVWLRNCYIAHAVMRNPGVFSLVWLRNCYIAHAVMRISQNHPLCSISKKPLLLRWFLIYFAMAPHLSLTALYLVTISTGMLKIFATFRIVSICLPVAAAKWWVGPHSLQQVTNSLAPQVNGFSCLYRRRKGFYPLHSRLPQPQTWTFFRQT